MTEQSTVPVGPDAPRGASGSVAPSSSLTGRVSTALSARPWARLVLLLSAPLTWLVLIYIVSLALLFVTALWTVNDFTGDVERTWNFDNIVDVFTGALYRTVTLRTLWVALLVTVIDIAIALPVAFFMAKVATPRLRYALVIAVLTPLWASYLVKAYAWRSMLANNGIIDWAGGFVGLESPGYGLPGVVMTQAYIWLPYVILPIYAAFERVPDNLVAASSDLGAKGWMSFRTVIWPLVIPGVIAGSIFSFSLTLGDYITVNIVGGANQMLGNLIYGNIGAASNLPLAAAISLIPLIIITVYLALVRRTGALNQL